MHGHKIIDIQKGSIAEELDLAKGDILLRINGREITDVIDYIEWMEDEYLELSIIKADGEEWIIELEKEPGEDLGLIFEYDLMDQERTCKNKCIFCFVDQLPKGMRSSLYYKDDDWRLSFLVGNYITLTNLSDFDVTRIVEKQISPLYISVHTTNPDLRKKMLNNRFAGDALKYLQRMADAGIQLHTQIVLCPSWNDGEELDQTISDLWEKRNSVQSVAVVPVGLTGHRDRLTLIQPFSPQQASQVIDQVDKWQKIFRSKGNTGFIYAADEFFVTAGRDFPPADYYDNFPQVENGVGLTVQFASEFEEALAYRRLNEKTVEKGQYKPINQTIVTGFSAAGIIQAMADKVNTAFQTRVKVIGVENRFFGPSVTVAGLVTGGDIIKSLQGMQLGRRILIPETMLRKGQDVFLDDMSLAELEERLGIPVVAVPVRGDAFLHALLMD